MYGMIHKAAHDYGLERMPGQTMDRLLREAEIDPDHFLSGQHYSDQITIRFLSAIAAELNLEMDELFVEFGRHWIKFVSDSDYAPVLEMSGDNLTDFLSNLDALHVGVKSTMTEASLPSFEVVKSTPERIEVVYRSEREGLEPFVCGLFEGLMDRFGETGAVAYRHRDDGSVFTIERGAEP